MLEELRSVTETKPSANLRVTEAARQLDCATETVRRWLREGRIAGVRPGGDRLGWRVPQSEIDRLLIATKVGQVRTKGDTVVR